MMKRRMNTLLVIVLLGINMALGQTNGFCNLVWNDEFNGNTLSSDWTKEQTCYGGGNNELECYTARPKNIYLDNGNLVLAAFREDYTGTQAGCTDTQGCTWSKPYTSGRINTAASHSWTYGRFEARLKQPKGTHLWPAFWMMPTDYAYGGWAASGEIDIMEERGDNPTTVSGTVHHGAAWPNNVYTTSGDQGIGVDLSQDFHVYAVEWTTAAIKWYLDGDNFFTVSLDRWFNTTVNGPYWAKGQPFDRRFNIILNLAVGGGFFNGYPALTDAQSAAWPQPQLRVDYVRVWSQGGDCSANPFGQTSAAANDNNNRPSTSAAATPTPASSAAANNNNNNNNVNNGATCNGQGYDHSTYDCVVNDAGNSLLCPKNTQGCASACYAPSSYCCVGGNLMDATSAVCRLNANNNNNAAAPAATSTPAAAPTSAQAPATSAASNNNNNNNGNNNCGSGLQSCGGQCYSPSSYSCATNQITNAHLLCPVSTPNACGGACFAATNYRCDSNYNLVALKKRIM